MAMNAGVLIAVSYQTVVSFPRTSIDITAFNNSSLKNWNKLCVGTIFNDTHKQTFLSLMQSQNKDVSSSASSDLTAALLYKKSWNMELFF
jgi:hypothetical protein